MRRLFPILALALATLGLALSLEIVLRFLPVSDSLRRQPVHAGDPVLRFAPNRDVVHSRGWRMKGVVEHRVNGAGFLNPVDYDAAARTPLLAVVGDSYVEALVVPFDRTAAGRVAAALGDAGRVYTFGVSGASLAQYLVYSRHAGEVYRPDRLVVFVIMNDFDESVAADVPGLAVFDPDPSGELRLRVRDYAPSLLQRALRDSALARYLEINLKIAAAPERLRRRIGLGDDEERFVGNTRWEVSPARLSASKAGIEAFLRRIANQAGLPREHILLVVDGLRPQLYEPGGLDAVEHSFAARMRAHFMARARRGGFEVVDLQPIFERRHRETGVRFEFEDDHHWNAAGHEEAARALLASRTVGAWLDEIGTRSP